MDTRLREILDFRELVRVNVPRIGERMGQLKWPHRYQEDAAVTWALLQTWRLREHFSPGQAAWITWFGYQLEIAHRITMRGLVRLKGAETDEEAYVLHVLEAMASTIYVKGAALPVAPDFGLSRPGLHLDRDGPVVKTWQEAFADGVLPEDPDEIGLEVPGRTEPEMEAVCQRIDEAKVRIAQEIRDRGLADTEE